MEMSWGNSRKTKLQNKKAMVGLEKIVADRTR